MTLAEFENSRPDLAINWDRAHNPEWAEDPHVAGILATGSFENYLRANYGGDFDPEPVSAPAAAGGTLTANYDLNQPVYNSPAPPPDDPPPQFEPPPQVEEPPPPQEPPHGDDFFDPPPPQDVVIISLPPGTYTTPGIELPPNVVITGEPPASPPLPPQPAIDNPPLPTHTAGMTLAEYADSRPDLIVNWRRTSDPAWANDPNVQQISRDFGSLEQYLQASYGGAFSAAQQPPPQNTQQPGAPIIADETHKYQGRSGGFDWYIQDDGVNVWRYGVLAGHDSREIIFDTRELVGPSIPAQQAPPPAQNSGNDLSLPPRAVGQTYRGETVMQLRDRDGAIKQWIDTAGFNDLRPATTLGVMVHSVAIDGPGAPPAQNNPPPISASNQPPPPTTTAVQLVPFAHPVSGQTVNIPTTWRRVGTTSTGNPVFQLFENGQWGDSAGTDKEWELNPNGQAVFHTDSTTPGSYSPQTATVYPGQTVTPQGVPPATITPATAAAAQVAAAGGMSDTQKIMLAVGVSIAVGLGVALLRRRNPARRGRRSRSLFR